MELEEDPDGEILSMVVTMDDWEQLCVEMDRFKGAMELDPEESYADNECRRGTLTPAATPKPKSTWSTSQASTTNESSRMSESSSTNSVETPTPARSSCGMMTKVLHCSINVRSRIKKFKRNGIPNTVVNI